MVELIINQNENIETICLVENGKLIEKYQNDENTKNNRLEGNIYVGRVADIIPGMQSTFVDYGDSKKGLLHLKDAIPQIDEKNNKDNTILDNKQFLSDIENFLKEQFSTNKSNNLSKSNLSKRVKNFQLINEYSQKSKTNLKKLKLLLYHQ